jgi:hypothetical protein
VWRLRPQTPPAVTSLGSRARGTRGRRTPREPSSTRSPGRPRHPGHPRSRGRVAVSVRACVGARWRAAGSAGRASPPAADRILASGTGGLSRTGLIPRSSHRACRTRRLRAVRAIGARRNPSPVRRPVVAAGHRFPVHGAPVHGAADHRPAVDGSGAHGSAAAGRARGREVIGRVPRGRREASRRAHACAVRLARARLGRRISGSPQQLAVLVVVGAVRPVRPRAALWPVGAAFAQASSPVQAVAIAAPAGVATFHQVPLLDLVVQPRRRTRLISRV